jgi:hypothetical protein
MTIMEHLVEHHACRAGKEWLEATGITTWHDLWDQCPDSDWMLWLLHHAALSKHMRGSILRKLPRRDVVTDDVWFTAGLYINEERAQLASDLRRIVRMKEDTLMRWLCNDVENVGGTRAMTKWIRDNGLISYKQIRTRAPDVFRLTGMWARVLRMAT